MAAHLSERAYVVRVVGVTGIGGPRRRIELVPIGDGGFVGWAGALRQDRKERLLIGAIGTEGLIKLCRTG